MPGQDKAGSPTALLVSTQPWGFAGRLAGVLKRAGFHVHGAAPKGTLLHHSNAIDSLHPLRHGYLVSDVGSLLPRLRPSIVIPCDDHAAEIIRDQHKNPDLVELIERSLGDPRSFGVAASKSQQMALAAEMGLGAPKTIHVENESALLSALQDGEFPRVLKVDGTWAGIGVAVINSWDDVEPAWARVNEHPRLVSALARSAREHSLRPIIAWRAWQRVTPDLQDFVVGLPANRAVLCDRGRVLFGVSVEVLQTIYPNGPASVMRVVEHADMTETASAIVAKLGLSGFLGFDFVLDAASGRALFIEMNPRATPICALPVPDETGLDFAGCLFTHVTGRSSPPVPPPPNKTIAVFPGEWFRDPASRYLREAWHDVPWEDPALLYAYMDEVRADQRFNRLKAFLGRRSR